MIEPIAIIGSGCRFPGGVDSPSKLWKLIHQPRDLSSKPPASRFDIDPFYHPSNTHHGTINTPKAYWLEDSDRSNVKQFDAGFFSMQPGELDAMDPQQRLLMEVVYDSLCAAGQQMEKLRGSDTAVYVGNMCDDYNIMLTRDWETIPRYTAPGVERAILSNRLSYFFDWHGPSITLDTACSSSLVALDQAVDVLRSGKSRVAIAAGTSLILSPAISIIQSKFGMLSASGHCAMWDASADGYARGEGVAAVILKTLSQAIADRDPIESVIRGTAVNQDGRTPGLTMPSSIAQSALIRGCYARAGLDPVQNPRDRPQVFHAHGTGTQAGDPQEAEAIVSALFPAESSSTHSSEKLPVISIKTVIGHTEGTAGLASIIGTSQALQHGIIPPNLHFHELNPRIQPFSKYLDVPTTATKWPTHHDSVRRASINCFGFGGTNAHCILEEYVPPTIRADSPMKTSSDSLFTPLTFSAASESALKRILSQHLDYLKTNPTMNFADYAYTLQRRTSTLPYRKAIAALTLQDAINSIEGILENQADGEGQSRSDESNLGVRYTAPFDPPRVLGIFTGQGAQWPRMGAQLLESSSFVARRISELDEVLQMLPRAQDRPKWSIRDQLLATSSESRVTEAALSQPLCTAVQIVLVDILRTAGIHFIAVIGHSSGEIGAAYAAGLLSARDAICIAYFRGLLAKLASSPNANVPRGAMVAVGTGVDEATKYCEDNFSGRLQVAAVNSSSSVTLSGDEDCVDDAIKQFTSQGMFARKLKVDTAYHSVHMKACAASYFESLESCNINPTCPSEDGPLWFSSVYEGKIMDQDSLTNQYWVDNMCLPVLFAHALSHAADLMTTFDVAIEVGPHPALQSPVMATMDQIKPLSVNYTGLLFREKHDIEQISAGLGRIWTWLGSNSVQFTRVEALLSGDASETMVMDLPLYPFDHQREYWAGGRIINSFKHQSMFHSHSPILGKQCVEATTLDKFQWRNILNPNEVGWLQGHALQGQVVFPAAGYVSMAIEAITSIALQRNTDAITSMVRLTDIEILRAIIFNDDSMSVETLLHVSLISTSNDSISAEWACYSWPEGVQNANLNAKGRVMAYFSPPQVDSIPLVKESPYNLVSINRDDFYSNLARIGYDYSSPFQGLSEIQRRSGYSIGTLTDDSLSTWDNRLILHPGMLDSALQTIFAAWSHPKDTNLRMLHVPISIAKLSVNMCFTSLGERGKQKNVQFESIVRNQGPSTIEGDICLSTEDSHVFVQLEGLRLVPFAKPSPKDDLPMFSRFHYMVASPDADLAAEGDAISVAEKKMYHDVDRIAYWYLRHASLSIPPDSRSGLLPHFQNYLKWCDHMVNQVSQDKHYKLSSNCNADSRSVIDQILASYKDRQDIRFIQVVGDHLISVIHAGNSMLEYMNQDGLLRAFYEESAICAGPTSRWLARIISQISFRHPDLKIFEVGAGTGGHTSAVLREINGAYDSYTFTDISSGFFMAAEERFSEESNRMTFRTFDMERDPSEQGFVQGSYDVVIAVNVLHVSTNVGNTLSNIRRLLKPGGFLIVAEPTSTDMLFSGMTVGTLPGWWVGADSGRPWGPVLSLSQWDDELKNNSFSGIDTMTPDISSSLAMGVFVSQAVDERVNFLRDPLVAYDPVSPEIPNSTLAVIGGTRSSVSTLRWQLTSLLSPHFPNMATFDTLGDFASSKMIQSISTAEPVTVLSLTDLDRPYLEDFTEIEFNHLQVLLTRADTLVWVTQEAKNNPFSYMMMGLIRTVNAEQPTLNPQIFDLSKSEWNEDMFRPLIARDLAEAILRHHFLASNEKIANEVFWTIEPEIFCSAGKHLVRRLLPDKKPNERYNSQTRQIVTTTNDPADGLEHAGNRDQSLQLSRVSPLSRTIIDTPIQDCKFRIVRSLVQSLAVGTSGYLRLCTGIDLDTGCMVLALSGSTQSPAIVPRKWCIPLRETPSASTIMLVGANLLAQQIISLVPHGRTLLVNGADLVLRSALRNNVKGADVKLLFTTTQVELDEESKSILLHPDFPQHLVQSLIPTSVSVFINFSRGPTSDAVRDAIVACLPPTCIQMNEAMFVSSQVQSASEVVTAQPERMLQESWNQACHSDSHPVESISFDDAHLHKVIGLPLAVVDWTLTKSLAVNVQRIDSCNLFQAEKTYLLVGMTGSLGQSLAKWMIEHGAKHVVLASRKPNVNCEFIEEMRARYEASIEVMILDILSHESLQSVLATITVTLPPIGGVVNGAMVWEDQLFHNMTYEQFRRVTDPKVRGTQLLDEFFFETSLEFFIVASSVVSIIGWSGQSNYIAANEFMTSLVNKRRNRGVAGSAMCIPAVLGVGVAAGKAGFDFDYFSSLRYINISEEDFHQLFAETILAGQPQKPHSDQSSPVVMGIDYIPAGLEVRSVHKRSVTLNHLQLREENDAHTHSGKAVHVQEQLQNVDGYEAACTVVRDAFVVHMKRMLRLKEEEPIQESISLIDQGVDSLIAVEIRTWFLKELQFDIPVLKIMGGASITDLVEAVVEKFRQTT